MILDIELGAEAMESDEVLWAHLAISALQAGHWPSGIIIGFA